MSVQKEVDQNQNNTRKEKPSESLKTQSQQSQKKTISSISDSANENINEYQRINRIILEKDINATNKYQQEYAKKHGIKPQKKSKPKQDFKITLDKDFPSDTKVYMVDVYGWIGDEWKFIEQNFISRKLENRDFNIRRYEKDYGRMTRKVKLVITDLKPKQ